MKSKRHLRSGFTLIAVVLVLSLLTVLVVSSMVVGSIEIQAEYNSSQEEVARQNALFGLNQALNQLQMTAGADRRVTARADILNPTANPNPSACGYHASQPAADSGQSFWTGVWKTTGNDFAGGGGNGLTANPDPSPSATFSTGNGPAANFVYYDVLPTGAVNSTPAAATLATTTAGPSRNQLYYNTNVSWLVSWPYSASLTHGPDPTQNLTAQLPAGASTVTVANNLNATTLQNPSVKGTSNVVVPKVPILETKPGANAQVQTGSFAYWVADEGIKAKADIPDPYLGVNPTTSATFVQSQAHFQVAQSSAVSQVLNAATTLGSSSFNSLGASDLRNKLVIAPTVASLAFADVGSTWSDFDANESTYTADFTVDSYGVLSDNFNGGLRKDLTAAFEDQKIYWSNFGDLSGNGNAAVTEACRKVYSFDSIVGQNGTYPVVYPGVPGNILLDGMRWDSLFNYYNLYKAKSLSPVSSNPGSFTNYASGSNAPYESGTVPVIVPRFFSIPNPGASVYTNGLGVLVSDPIMPTIMAFNYNLGLGLKQLPTPPPTATLASYDLMLFASPQIVLYNPYDVQLATSAAGSILLDNPYLYYNPVYFTLDSSTTAYATGFTENIGGLRLSAAFNGVSFAPGELRLFGQASDTNIGTEAWPVATSSSPYEPQVDYNWNANSTVSQGYAPLSPGYIYEEITGVPLSGNPNHPVNIVSKLAAPTTGTHYIGFNGPYMSLWPYSTSYEMVIPPGSVSIPGATGTVSTPTDSAMALVTDATDITPYPLVAYSYRTTGITNPSVYNPSQSAASYALSYPAFAAGGAPNNPLFFYYYNLERATFSSSGMMTGLPSSSYDIQGQSTGNNADAFWQPGAVGSVPTQGTTQSQICLKQIPRQPLVSLGQFKNMNLSYSLGLATTASNSTHLMLGFSFCPLGGSYQNCLGPQYTCALYTYAPNPGLPAMSSYGNFLDDNYLANGSLFDGYFLSTVPPAALTDPNNWQVPQISSGNFSQAYINGNQSLPNSRLVYYNRSRSGSWDAGASSASPLFAPLLADLQCPNSANANLRKPAANLLINGAFNINSTSIPAWEALLSSTSASSNILQTFQTSSGSLSLSATPQSFGQTDVPFLNALIPVSFTGSMTANSPWFGLVNIQTGALKTLATNIVAQIQARGPFLSLGDFLNRRLGISNTNLTTSGALQAAIDLTWPTGTPAASIAGGTPSVGPAVIPTNEGTPDYPSTTFTFSNPPVPNTGVGVPGTLTQPDLVQLIAPVIAARSDTFKIRTYGESVNPTTKAVLGKAWCEAVVQRVPEYLYSSESGAPANGNYAYDDPSPSVANQEDITNYVTYGLSPINATLGRRFKIVSFRWLNANEL